MKLAKRKAYGDGIDEWWELFFKTTTLVPAFWKIPEITILVIGYILIVVWAFVQMVAWVLVFGLLPIKLHIAGLVLLVFCIFLSGEMGIRFRIWLELESAVKRRRDISIDLTPVNSSFTRILIYSVLAAEIGFFVWFQVLKTRPEFFIAPVMEIYREEAILFAAEQMRLYWWLLPSLSILSAMALGLMDSKAPLIKIYFRKTKITNLTAVLFGIFVLVNFFIWWDEVYPAGFSLFRLFEQ